MNRRCMLTPNRFRRMGAARIGGPRMDGSRGGRLQVEGRLPSETAEPDDVRVATVTLAGRRDEPPRGPFGGTNQVALGAMGAREEADELLSAIDALLARLGESDTEGGGRADALRETLRSAKEACREGCFGLARYILSLFRGR